MTSWSSARTETRTWRDIKVGDKVLDPNTGRMMSVWAIEDFTARGGSMWVHATLKRTVVRKVWPSSPVEFCIPKESN